MQMCLYVEHFFKCMMLDRCLHIHVCTCINIFFFPPTCRETHVSCLWIMGFSSCDCYVSQKENQKQYFKFIRKLLLFLGKRFNLFLGDFSSKAANWNLDELPLFDLHCYFSSITKSSGKTPCDKYASDLMVVHMTLG